MANLTQSKNLGITDQPLKLSRKLKTTRLKRNIGCWSHEEQAKYVNFLSFSLKKLQSRNQRKYQNNKVFKEMSQFIGTRDGIQCRSHHVKQLRTHKQIRKIIDRFSLAGQGVVQSDGFLSFPVNDYGKISLQSLSQKGNSLAEVQVFSDLENANKQGPPDLQNEAFCQYKFWELAYVPQLEYQCQLFWLPLPSNLNFGLPS